MKPKDTRVRVRNIPAWKKAEFTIARTLQIRGVKCKAIGAQNKSFDVLTEGGLRIEVKQATLARGLWNVNVSPRQRRQCDFLVVVLHGLTGHRGIGQAGLYLILRAPIKKRMYRLSIRALLNNHSRQIGNWAPIIRTETRRLAREERCQLTV